VLDLDALHAGEPTTSAAAPGPVAA
jgi:hypothetical protein